VCALAALLAGPAPAQQQEWWDLQKEAVEIIKKDSASAEELSAAKRLLQQALRANARPEGKYGTYRQDFREDFLPYFYLGWANLKLGKYDEAEKNLAKSGEMGFITSGAPEDLKALYKSLSQLVPQLAPAAKALSEVKDNSLAKQCLADSAGGPGKAIRDAMGAIESILAAPKVENAGGLKEAIAGLQSAQAECVTKIRGAVIAGLNSEYNAARDAVAVEGVSDLLGQATRAELDSAVKAGNDAAAKGDEDGLKAATRKLQGLQGKVASDVDGRLAGLAKEAERLLEGNVGALNERAQLGTSLANLAGRTKTERASGKTGADLAVVVSAGKELEAALGQARAAIEPILQSKGAALAAAAREFDAWSRDRACDVKVVDADADVARVSRQAADATKGQSADSMDRAKQELATARSGVEEKMQAALPLMESQARGALSGAAELIKNLPNASDKQSGQSFTAGIEQAVAKKDACGIEGAIAKLNQWIGVKAPELEKKRNAAIARSQPSLDAARGLLGGFGGILKPETIEALKGPVESLASLSKTSYDDAQIDKAGKELQSVVARAQGEVKGQMEAGIQALRQMRKDPRWASDVRPARRAWLEENLPAVEKAVQSTSEPDLLARFAKEFPRARLELAMVTAFEALYDRDDPEAAAKVLEGLGPGIRAGSAALNYALSYCYWWQGRGAASAEREGLFEKARKAYDDGKAFNVDLASLGAPLFAPAFVQEMTAR